METLEDNVKWVQDFNLNLGMNVLGGIFGVLEVFSDPVNLLQDFYDIIERGDELRQAYGGKTEKFKVEIRKYLLEVASRLPENSFNVLTNHYVPFYYEGCLRLKHNQKFIDWIKKTEFSIMPDIFSKYVLLYAISKIEIHGKIVSTVLETMREMENESLTNGSDTTTKGEGVCSNGTNYILKTDGTGFGKKEPLSVSMKKCGGGILAWVGIFLLIIGWIGVLSSIPILLNSPVQDGTWFIYLFLGSCKILVGILFRRIARRMGFTHNHHPVCGAIVGGVGIMLSVFGWIGLVGVILSIFSERSIIDPFTNSVASIFLVVLGTVVRYYGKRISRPASSVE